MSLRYATSGAWEREGPWGSDREEDSSDEEGKSQRKSRLRRRKVPTERQEQRQSLFKNLLSALWTPSDEKKVSPGPFAACGTVKYSDGFILPSFHVEGAGELQLPLSAEDTVKLRAVCDQAALGRGLDTKIARGCLQVDASKVSFPAAPDFISNIIQPLATKAVGSLGLDGAAGQLEVHFSKVLLYEGGGNFTFHSDMTTGERTFDATLLLQLPTDEGYTGGKLVVKQYNAMREFDCHMVSTLGFCYTVFFSDCLFELQKIESGSRLCLAFNLVKRDPSLDPDYVSNKVAEVEAVLQPWLEEATEGKLNVFGGKLAIPLQHKYTEESLSFDGLKGEDSIVAGLLKDCRDMKKEKLLDLGLCLVSKHMVGYSYSDGGFEDAHHHTMYLFIEGNIQIKNWITFDETPAAEAFENLRIDMKKETVALEGKDPFGDKPDEEIYDDYDEHYNKATVEERYHIAMLVVWPKKLVVGGSESGGCDSKRQRADTELTEYPSKRAKSSPVETIDLDLSL